MKKLLRLLLVAAGMAGAAYFLLPLGLGITHIGMFYPAVICFLISLVAAFPHRFLALWRGPYRRIVRSVTAVAALGIAAVLITCLFIGTAAADAPQEDEEVTVVVLGCQVLGENPSVMLMGRIQRAYDYLSAHPESKCVATGGVGDSATISEGECIRRTLVKLGIDESRIYVEGESRNTMENMAFAADIIETEGLSATVAIVSDNFHQLRASIFAARAGLEARALGCGSPWFLGPGYWAREVLALAAIPIRGY